MKPPFIHPQALCESRRIGAGTRIWAFAHVLPGAQLGADCNICDGVLSVVECFETGGASG